MREKFMKLLAGTISVLLVLQNNALGISVIADTINAAENETTATETITDGGSASEYSSNVVISSSDDPNSAVVDPVVIEENLR